MSRRVILISTSVVSVIVIAAIAAYWFLLRSDAPDPVSLGDAIESVSTSSTSPGATPTEPLGALEGVWETTDGSFAGYRVEEELANVGFATAAGRTDALTGVLSIADGTVTTVEITVDLTGLRSDSDRRDQAIETQALETREFPTAHFVLVEPVALPAGAASGVAFAIDTTGDLTIHGVTNRVTIGLEAQLVDGLIVVVGSTEIRFAEYAIEPPQAMVLLSVEDHGIMEFQLLFSRT